MSSAGARPARHGAGSSGIDTGAEQTKESTKRSQILCCRMRKQQSRGRQKLSRCRRLAQDVGSVVIGDAAQRRDELVDEEEHQDGSFAGEDRQEYSQRGMPE